MTRWAFLDPETGEWIEVKSAVVIFESRAALTEAVAEALHEAHVPPWFYGHRSDDLTYAAAIVARMLEGRSD